ncbi:hypothetical protein MNB_SV-15-4 [hydrothermal vent metagenome]|uniref:Uncharacterized protein n=1 Tax=hydrothermal vent metagenome TaxID=652676 RepID=A0A1W1EJI3_9ZZZZ
MNEEIITILVMIFPMLMFGIYPGIVVSNWADKKYEISETQKRAIMVVVTVAFTLTLSTLLYYI